MAPGGQSWGTEMSGSETKTALGEPREAGRVANIFEGINSEVGGGGASGQTRGPRRWTELTCNLQRRYSWVFPQHSSSPGNL